MKFRNISELEKILKQGKFVQVFSEDRKTMQIFFEDNLSYWQIFVTVKPNWKKIKPNEIVKLEDIWAVILEVDQNRVNLYPPKFPPKRFQ